MAQASANPQRRKELKAALKRVGPDDTLTLEELAFAWGVTKQRFVTVKNAIVRFPDRIATAGNVHIFPAKKALEEMYAHEMRHEQAAAEKHAKTNAILGRSKRGRVKDEPTHTVNELRTLSQMRSEIEEQEREQGFYVPVAEVASVAGDVFGEISDFMSTLSNKMDPHGLLPAAQREQIDTLGADALMGLYRRIKEMLSPDAKPRRDRTPAGRTRKPRARR